MQNRILWISIVLSALGILIVLAIALQPDQQTAGIERVQTTKVDQEDEGPFERQAENSLIEFVQTPWTGDLDGMLERRLIRILTVPTETSYFLEKGKSRGITAEFFSAFETFINKRFPQEARHLKVKVVVVPVSSGDLLPALLDGRGDIATARLTITEGRKDRVDFSNPIVRDIDEIVVTGPASSNLTTLDDLAGKEILARQSSSYWEHLQVLNKRFESEGKKPIKLREAPEELSDSDLMQMVNAGLVEIIIVDNYKAELWAKILPEIRVHPDIAINRDGQIGVIMRQGSPLLKETLNTFIEGHKGGTTFGNTVIKRYLGSTRFIKRATSPTELGKFNEVIGLFHEYGKQYNLDPLLLMAQGYQESGLDNQARSPSGAIGIMQLLPSTAREMKIDNVHELEANIHAGVKYVRFIIDSYFDNVSIDDFNKTLLAFAAYNAGPNRISRLRDTTQKRNLDPNVWFGNVELVVSEKVGAEPVNYVSNIFKYYVGFSLMEQHRETRRQVKEDFENTRR
jgi:membrane-bound lytic murein transglycosylase MltF